MKWCTWAVCETVYINIKANKACVIKLDNRQQYAYGSEKCIAHATTPDTASSVEHADDTVPLVNITAFSYAA